MFGFEMAYIPSGSYYISSAQHVIDEERSGKLTEEIKNPSQTLTIKIGENSENDSSRLDIPKKESFIVIHYPRDSTTPFDIQNVKEKLGDLDKNRSIKVVGYASSEGAKRYNQRLSKKRAERVARYAAKIGVNVSQIKAIGELECKANNPKSYPSCRKVEVLQSNED